VTAISYGMHIDGRPADPDLLAAVQQIEVEDHADMADMLRLSLAIGVRKDSSGWSVLDEDLFRRLTNIKVNMAVGSGAAEPLIDAYVIETRARISNGPGQSTLDILAMDPTVLMNLQEKIRPWPDMADSDIARAVFGEHGFTAKVAPTQPARQVVDYATIQRGTDIQFLRHLAWRNGCECYVEIHPVTSAVEGHFHPPQLQQPPQGVLSINMGEATNVNRFEARYDMLRPTTAQITGLDVETRADQPARVESPSQDRLGKETAFCRDRPRRILLSRTGLTQAGELQIHAQAVVDRSAWAITADGELNTVAYGGILRAKRPVSVRGAGRQFSGTYYVEKVLHTFGGEGYSQHFTLRRNALGLTGQERFKKNGASR